MPGILSADSYTIRKVHKYPINCSADELLNESFLTSKGNNFFEGSPSRGLFYSAGRRGARTSQRSSRRFHKKKNRKRKGKKNHNPRPINLIRRKTSGYWFSQTAARCFPNFFHDHDQQAGQERRALTEPA